MASIIVNACENTSNYAALNAVLGFITANNRSTSYGHEYRHEININVGAGEKLKVCEKRVDIGVMTCDCSFQVSKFNG